MTGAILIPTDPTCTATKHLSGKAYKVAGCRCPEAIEAVRASWAKDSERRGPRRHPDIDRPRGAHAPVDIHPDDLAARIDLRDRLRALRVEQGHSQRALAASIGWNRCDISQREAYATPNYRIATYVPWANGLDHHFHLYPVDVPGLTDVPEATALEALGDDTFQVAATLIRLVVARKATCVQHELADRIGINHAQISHFESGETDNMPLSGLQRYARALGGWLELRLTPFEDPIAGER